MSVSDPRTSALRRFALSITAFTVLGHALFGFEQAYATPVVGIVAAYLTEIVLESLEAFSQHRRPRYLAAPSDVVTFLLPPHITGLACAMLLYGNSRLMPTVCATVIAVASKYVIRVRVNGRPRHVLNPSNFGISVTLLLFPWVGIAPPYEFTENLRGWADWIVPIAILGAGTMLNAKLTRKGPLIVAWVVGFAVQAVLRGLLTSVTVSGALLPLTGVALVLFTNYMITDPGTTPMGRRGQVAFGAGTAAAYGVLVQIHVVFGFFFGLVAVCAIRGLWLAFVSVRRAPAAGRHQDQVARPRTPADEAATTLPVPARAD